MVGRLGLVGVMGLIGLVEIAGLVGWIGLVWFIGLVGLKGLHTMFGLSVRSLGSDCKFAWSTGMVTGINSFGWLVCVCKNVSSFSSSWNLLNLMELLKL